MNIAVIAANGRSGRAFVDEALRTGHVIRAGVHGTNNLPKHPHLTVVKCDATVEDDLRTLLSGQDAVVCLIGHIKGSKPSVQTDSIRQTVIVMQSLGIKRIVSLTGTGVRFPSDNISMVDKFISLGIHLVDPARVQDGIAHVKVLQQSDLDWTVIRVSKLLNTRPKSYKLTVNGPSKLYVARQEVAKAILEVLSNKTFIKQAPIISTEKAT